MRLNPEQIKQLVGLQRFIEEEQGSIDAMLLIAQAGFHEAPFEFLCSCYEGDLESWQAEEFSETLGDLLDAIERFVDESYNEDWTPETQARFQDLLGRARHIEDAFAPE